MPHNTLYSDIVEINAPREFVWAILVDLEKYPQWNPFTWRIDTPLLQPGNRVDLHVRMPKRGDRVQQEEIRAVDPPETLAWGMQLGGRLLLHARREQRLTALDANRCTYQTWDAFGGWLTPLVVWLFGEDILSGFNNMAYALKRRAEQAWAARERV